MRLSMTLPMLTVMVLAMEVTGCTGNVGAASTYACISNRRGCTDVSTADQSGGDVSLAFAAKASGTMVSAGSAASLLSSCGRFRCKESEGCCRKHKCPYRPKGVCCSVYRAAADCQASPDAQAEREVKAGRQLHGPRCTAQLENHQSHSR